MSSCILSWLVPALLLGFAVAPGNASPVSGLGPGNGTVDGLLDVNVYYNGSLAETAMQDKRSVLAKRMTYDGTQTFTLNARQLRNQVSKGRSYLFPMMMYEGNDLANHFTNTMQLGNDPLGKGWQRKVTDYTVGRSTRPNDYHVAQAWSEADITQAAASSLNPIKKHLEDLEVGTPGVETGVHRFRKVSNGIYPAGPNICIALTQDKVFDTPTNPNNQPTGARYESWFNILDGVIIVKDATSPRVAALDNLVTLDDERLPRVQHLSELLMWQWMKFHDNGFEYRYAKLRYMSPGIIRARILQMKDWLNYIVLEGSSNVHTHSVVRHCIHSMRGNDADAMPPLPTYPDVQWFAPGHWCYYALLATEGSASIAWLLGQHRETFSYKVLSRVGISSSCPEGDGNDELALNPTLIWQIKENTLALRQQAAALDRVWKPAADADPPSFPKINNDGSPIQFDARGNPLPPGGGSGAAIPAPNPPAGPAQGQPGPSNWQSGA